MNRSKHNIASKLEYRILKGLACEWEQIVWELNDGSPRLMYKPLFRIEELKNRLGYWSHAKQEICMSRDFVLNHPWDSVCDVLRHEMAHQYAHQVLDAFHEKPHGPAFQKACRVLRANPKASGSYRSLHERLDRNDTDDNDRLLIRIKKLMALAESQNRHEAEAAMLKAHELIKKYNIDLIAHDEKRNFTSVFVGKPALRHFRETYSLSHLIQDFYFIHGVWVPAYVIEREKMGRVLEISGTPRNVKLAGYIYDFVMNFIDARWKDYNRKKKLNRYRKTDFAVGIIEGFRSKLEKQDDQEPAATDQRALVAVTDPLLKKYISWRFPHLRTFRRSLPKQDADVLNDGIKIGKKLVIAQGITSTGEAGKLLPE